jgi:hypothetical protein
MGYLLLAATGGIYIILPLVTSARLLPFLLAPASHSLCSSNPPMAVEKVYAGRGLSISPLLGRVPPTFYTPTMKTTTSYLCDMTKQGMTVFFY